MTLMMMMMNVGDFDVFSQGHSQYLAFFLDELGGPDDKGYPLCSIDFHTYSFI